MKQVFNNRQLAHVWAQQTQASEVLKPILDSKVG